MIELEQNNQLNIETGGSGAEFPLINSWMESLVPAMEKRDQVASGNSDLPIPAFLTPLQKLWSDVGPIIITSYSHPETINFYKYVGGINLSLVLAALNDAGFSLEKERVVENWYDTVDMDSTVKKPLSLGDVIPMDVDLLGISQASSSLEPLAFSGKEYDTELVAQKIIGKLTNELFLEMQRRSLDRRNRGLAQSSLEALIIKRISSITRISRNSFLGVPLERRRVGQFLFEFGQRFGGLIMSDGQTNTRIKDITGIEGILASNNKAFMDLVLKTLEYLVMEKGAKVLKDLAPDMEELFLGTYEDKRCSIAVNSENGAFILCDRKTREILVEISDEDIISFVKQNGFIPFGKAETLAMIAGGVTFHMGSERGERDKAINALGIDCDEFRDFVKYLNSLRIGQDVEQGNYLFSVETIPGKAKPVSAILAFVLFGKDFLRNEILGVAGRTNKARVLTKDEFKKLAAEKLLAEVLV